MIELALGTVQFGTAYGIAGRGVAVPGREVREILARASACGVRLLDTAPSYGDIEPQLADLAGDRDFEFVSKIPAAPAAADAVATAAFVAASVRRSYERLGARLRTVLFHSADDLLGAHGEAAWRAATEVAGELGLRIGASCYSPQAAIQIRCRFGAAVVQVPGNALDQRLAEEVSTAGLAGVEIHLRSVFLQGLLLMPIESAVARVPQAAAALIAWKEWCVGHGYSALRAALAAAKALPGVRYCVLGVDRVSQFDEIVAAWRAAQPLLPGRFAGVEENVIDPRRWRVA